MPGGRTTQNNHLANPLPSRNQQKANVRVGDRVREDKLRIWYGNRGKGFGWGTVHHAGGSLRMPYRSRLDAPFAVDSVVMKTYASLARKGFMYVICPLCR
jgi:hypothetical protein